MALFQLDTQSTLARVRESDRATRPNSLIASVVRGVLGFAVVGIYGFMPWAICEFWIKGATELQMHIACALAFVAASGICLHRLIIGPGSLSRFYKLFGLAFPAFAACWVGSWMWRPDDVGVFLGLLIGTIVMGSILVLAFDAQAAALKVILSLFLLCSLGYYAGHWCENSFAGNRFAVMMAWGYCFGSGFGAGFGFAFYFCQEKTRAALSESTEPAG